MSFDVFDDQCPDCRPVLIDPETGRALPADSSQMQAVQRMWQQTSREERVVFHRITCLNSRTPSDMMVMQILIKRIETAMQTVH